MMKAIGRPRLILKRPVVWVTGASRGIGREIACQFASTGCIVAISARSQSQLRTVENEINSLGGQAKTFVCDVTDHRSVASTAAKIIHDFGTIDILVNNAGITSFESFQKTSIQHFDRVMAASFRGPVLVIKHVYPFMMKRKSGWIVNILSTAALETFSNSSAYSAAKSGLRALGNALREESRLHNIRVTNVYPGPTNTEMWSEKDRRKYGSRMMSANSVAAAILALYQMPSDVVVEEIILRPIQGDIE